MTWEKLAKAVKPLTPKRPVSLSGGTNKCKTRNECHFRISTNISNDFSLLHSNTTPMKEVYIFKLNNVPSFF